MGVLLLGLLAAAVLSANEDKVEFKQLEIDSPVSELYYCGLKQDIILVISEQKQVYRSENSGFSWKLVASSSVALEKISSVEQSKADSKLVAFLGSEGKNWYSEDCGKTVRSLNNVNLLEKFQFHPKMRSWGLAVSWNKCTDFDEKDCRKNRVLFLTKDLGLNWEPVLEYVVQFSWGALGLNNEVTKNFPMERIYVTQNSDPSEDQKMSGWTYSVNFLRSDDFFRSYEMVLEHGNKFLLADKYVLVAVAVEQDPEEVVLMISNDNNVEKFYRAELPIKKVPEHGYTLLDTSEGSIFIHVNHYGVQSKYGVIYVSDATGNKFSVSLMHNIRNRKGYCDFSRVDGLEGIYIANVYDIEYADQEFSGPKKEKDDLKYQRTVITFDKGGEWKNIEPPERDSNGKKIYCEDECYLHLHSVTSTFTPVYSCDNAVGIVLGTGNVGKYLSYKEDELNTYLSRDGGFSWVEIKKGEYIYELGDHGAIIVLADSQKATDTLFFSWNEGLTWEKIKIDSPMEVDNIIIEPSQTSQKFLVYGEKDGKGVTVAVDFTTYHEPVCRNPSKPGSSDSDYEIWSPSDGRTNMCLMGRKIEYVRRKREAECFNGEEFERPRFIENCECSESDYECDLGFYRNEGGTCVKIENYEFEESECNEYGYKLVTNGYRRVPGNSCEKGVASQYEPARLDCSDSFGFAVYAALGAVVLGGLIYVLKTRKEMVYEGLGKVKDFALICKKYAADRAGYSTDFSNAPEGPEDEEMIASNIDLNEEEFDPRS